MPSHHAQNPSRMTPTTITEPHHTYLEEMLFEAVVNDGVVVAFADG